MRFALGGWVASGEVEIVVFVQALALFFYEDFLVFGVV